MGVIVTLTDTSDRNEIIELSATAPLEIVEQLSTELDNGTARYLKTEADAKGIVAPLEGYAVTVDDVTFDFVGIDSRALLRRETEQTGIYTHEVALVETSKILQGVMIDGFAVSQPEDLSQRESLQDVVNRLLATTPFDYARTTLKPFTLTTDADVTQALSEVVSPEFKWNTQTTLWECLVRIGAVVDAVPRLVADANGMYTVVTFEFVNDYDSEVETIEDGVTNVSGESVDEGQYNSSLSAIVENLSEQE